MIQGTIVFFHLVLFIPEDTWFALFGGQFSPSYIIPPSIPPKTEVVSGMDMGVN